MHPHVHVSVRLCGLVYRAFAVICLHLYFLSPHCSLALWLSQREAQTHCAGFIPQLRGECLCSCVFLCEGDRVWEQFCAPVRETEYVPLKNVGFISSVLVCLNLLPFPILMCTGVQCVRVLLDSLIPSLPYMLSGRPHHSEVLPLGHNAWNKNRLRGTSIPQA